MGCKCAAYNCRGNYKGEPYSHIVKFPSAESENDEFNEWVEAMPNTRESLLKLKEIWICKKHFDPTCKWKTTRGGKRPSVPPSIFDGVPKSCLKSPVSTRRSTSSLSEVRKQSQEAREQDADRIKDFNDFLDNVETQIDGGFNFIKSENEVSVLMTNVIGSRIIQFFHFTKVESPFGFLHLKHVEKNGIPIGKNVFDLQKNSLLHKWSQVRNIVSTLKCYESSTTDKIKKVIENCKELSELVDNPTFQFIQEQLQLMLTSPKGRRFSKYVLMFSAELICVSPVAYRLLQTSETVILPKEKLVRELMNRSFQNNSLSNLFQELKTEQRLVNVLFDEVKLKKAMRYSNSHVVGHAVNKPDQLANSALAIEIVCHFGGPRFVLNITPVACLTAVQLKELIQEALRVIREKGGCPIALISDNCPLNQGTYSLFGGPGHIAYEGLDLFLIYDFPHIFKNVRNNWFTEALKELKFTVDGHEYLARWSDVVSLYEEDRQNSLRLTKLTYTSVNPKPLQRQSVPLVHQVFHEKTVAAMKALKDKLNIQEGTILFIEMISNWFKMLNIKDKFVHQRLRDNLRAPWSKDCDTFPRLEKICNTVTTCKWTGGRVEKKS